MLFAIVMMCSLVTEGDCLKLTDTRGLHIDEDACMVRVQEMISDLRREYELKKLSFGINAKKLRELRFKFTLSQLNYPTPKMPMS